MMTTRCDEQEVRVGEIFNTLFNKMMTTRCDEQEVRVSEIFNTLFNKMMTTRCDEQELRVSEFFNTQEFLMSDAIGMMRAKLGTRMK